MKKLLIAIAALAFAGCAEDADFGAIENNGGNLVRLAVSQAGASRAALDGMEVKWQDGDQIAVNGTAYDLKGSEADGWYLEVPESESYKAVYPASAAADDQITLPATQTYTAGSFDPAAHPMYAEAAAQGDGLAFSNLCGILKLTLTGNDDQLLFIKVKGNNGEALAGAGTMDAASKALIPADASALKELTLDCGRDALLAAEPTDFYIVLPAQTFTAGFTLDIYTDKGTMQKSTASEQQIVRSGMLSMPVLDVTALTVTPYDFSKGTFVLNEGSFGNPDASIVYISPAGEVMDRLYWRMNGSVLGGASQDLYITGGKMYIVSQNGPNLLTIADVKTMKKEVEYTKSEMGDLSWPTHVAVVGDKAYLRDNNGITQFDLTNKTAKSIEGSKGALKNRMAVVGDKVFVPANQSVLVIEGDAIVETIALPGAVSGVIRSYDDNLWVSCTTSPAQINKIGTADYSIIGTHELGDAKVGAGWGATPGISAKENHIYFSNASTKIYRHDFTASTTELMTDVKDHIANAGIVYNNLAVDPETEEVYFNTIKGYGTDFLINDITVFDFSGASAVLKHDYKNYTAFPAGIFFTADFK